MEGTYFPVEKGDHPGWDRVEYRKLGKRVGSTVLRLTRLTDIISPGAAQRAVFFDKGLEVRTPFCIHYLYPRWHFFSPPPIHHQHGTTLSMADGHAEYWKWKGRETVKMPRRVLYYNDYDNRQERLESDYEPLSEDGKYDLQRLQRVTWGRLGYSAEPGQ